MYTKIHYIAMAGMIKRSKDKQDIIDMLCIYYKTDNERFDESKFRDDCGLAQQLQFRFSKMALRDG